MKKWIQHKASGAPSARPGHCLVAHNHEIILFGGYTNINESNIPLSDVFSYNTRQKCWNKIECSGYKNTARFNASAVVYADKMWVYGGTLVQPNETLICLNLRNFEWKKFEGGPSRMLHSAVVYNDKMIVFAGADIYARDCNDVLVYDFVAQKMEKWITSGDLPCPRFSHAACVINDDMYVFGGLLRYDIFSDCYKLNLKTKEWTKIELKNSMDSQRIYYSHVKFENSLLLFGGVHMYKYYNDLYCLNFVNCKFSKIECEDESKPPGMSRPSSVIVGNSLYVFGGSIGSHHLNTLYELQLRETTYPKMFTILKKNSFTDVCF